jgi:hypothetical protein
MAACCATALRTIITARTLIAAIGLGVSASAASTANAWEPEHAPSLIWISAAHHGPAAGVAFSRDGARLLSVGPSAACASSQACSSVIIHDANTGERLMTEAYPAELAAGAFSQDGSVFVVSGCIRAAMVWCDAPFDMIAETTHGAPVITSDDRSMISHVPLDEAGHYQLGSGGLLDQREASFLIFWLTGRHWRMHGQAGAALRSAGLSMQEALMPWASELPYLERLGPDGTSGPYTVELKYLGIRSNGHDLILPEDFPSVLTAASGPGMAGLVLAREDGSITVFSRDLHTSRFTGESHTARLPGCDARSAGFGPDGLTLIIGCAHGGVRVATIGVSPLQVSELARHDTPMGVTFATVAGATSLIAVAGADGSVAVIRP